jgi:hypothetical protein
MHNQQSNSIINCTRARGRASTGIILAASTIRTKAHDALPVSRWAPPALARRAWWTSPSCWPAPGSTRRSRATWSRSMVSPPRSWAKRGVRAARAPRAKTASAAAIETAALGLRGRGRGGHLDHRLHPRRRCLHAPAPALSWRPRCWRPRVRVKLKRTWRRAPLDPTRCPRDFRARSQPASLQIKVKKSRIDTSTDVPVLSD